MSISNPVSNSNPAKLKIEWEGGKNKLSAYDFETKEQIEINCPFYFIPLDQLFSVVGFDKRENTPTPIYSNECRKHSEVLTVKTKKVNIATGTWKEIKDKVESVSGKYCKIIYAAMVIPCAKKTDIPTLKMVKICLSSSGFGNFTDAGIKDDGCVIEINNNGVEQKKMGQKFFSPVFKRTIIRAELLIEAIKMDKELQKYLSGENTKVIETIEIEEQKTTIEDLHEDVFPDGKNTDDSDLPF